MVLQFKHYFLQKEGFRDKAKMLGILASLAFTSPLISKTSDSLYNQLVKHEGLLRKPYYDSRGNLTVGIGFNLNDINNQKILSKLNIKKEDLKRGLNDNQVKALFDESMKIAKADALKYLPNLYSHPVQVQNAIIDMSFNLGYNRLNKFTDLKKSLMKRDYKTAANNMLKSLWARQVGKRANYLADLVRSAR